MLEQKNKNQRRTTLRAVNERMKDPQIQALIQRVALYAWKQRLKERELLCEQIQAARDVALSGNMGEFYKNQQNFLNLTTDTTDVATNIPTADEKLDDNAEVPDFEKEKWGELVCYLESLLNRGNQIDGSVKRFLRKFKLIALRNENSSTRNACWSKWLAIIAIIISALGILASGGIQWHFARRSEKNDKTSKLIKVIQKLHPWSEQQISTEDAKNVSVAFHAIIGALQKNVLLEQSNIQLKQKTNRLQADLSRTQNAFVILQTQYGTSVAICTQEKQKLYAEITALKKQIEELKAELIKRSVPQSSSRQEAKNE